MSRLCSNLQRQAKTRTGSVRPSAACTIRGYCDQARAGHRDRGSHPGGNHEG